MATVTHPSKEQVRDFMQQRRADHTPPPAPAEIRRQLGWNLQNAFDYTRRDFPR